MPRRIPDYPDAYAGWNLVSSVGSLISVGATVLFLYTVYDMLANKPAVQNGNSWAVPAFFVNSSNFMSLADANTTLDWLVASSTPYHAFDMIPVQS